MRIQHNIAAMSSYRNYNRNTSAVNKNLEKLSSGYKINRAGDDAAGLAISEKMRAQITGLNAAQKNVKDGISLVKTAEGAMQEIQDMLNRMDYLATQSANGTYQDEVDREALQAEVDQLLSEIDRIADSANFNGIKLLDGTLGMNDDAFTFSEVAAGNNVTQAAGSVALNFSAASSGNTHIYTGASSVSPSFKIDLTGLTATGGTATGTVTITMGGVTMTATLATGATKGAIAQAFADKYSGASIGKTFKIGSGTNTLYFKASNVSGVLNITCVGVGASSAASLGALSTEMTAGAVTAFDSFIGNKAAVSVAGGGAGMTQGSNNICDIVDVTRAKAKDDGNKAGISVTIDAKLVKDGNTLKIGSTTYTFKTKGSNSAVTATGSTVIDVSKFAGSTGNVTAEGIKEVIAQLSHKTASGASGASFRISAGSNNTIHVDVQGTASVLKKYESYDKLKEIFSATQPTADLTRPAGTQITVDPSKIEEGDSLALGDKRYVFTTNADLLAKTGSDVAYVDKNDAVNGLEAALKSAGYTVDKNGNSLNVYTENAKIKAISVPSNTKGLALQIGDTSYSYNQLMVKIKDMHADSLGVGGLSISNTTDAAAAIQTIKDAINAVSSVRGTLGATQNRLEHTANNLSVMAENIQDAESTIRDTDIAEEMMSYTKNNILVQSAQAMLAQANQIPQGVLQLLG